MLLVGDSSTHSLMQSHQIHKISKVALSTLGTASHNHTLDICRIICTWSMEFLYLDLTFREKKW